MPTRVAAFVALVTVFLFGLGAAAFAATISQTPNFNGTAIAPGSTYTISWTSTDLGPGETLDLRFTDMPLGLSDVSIAAGLPQNGSYTVTLPSSTVGAQYCYYLVSSGSPGVTYSNAALTPWSFTLDSTPPPPSGGTITQSPNFNGQTLPANSQYTITWTSSNLPSGATLMLHETDMPLGLADQVVATGLSQSGSFTVTVPSGPVGSQYCFYLVAPGSPAIYSNAALTPWSFTIGQPISVSSPASSPWSIALLAGAGCVLGVALVARRRLG